MSAGRAKGMIVVGFALLFVGMVLVASHIVAETKTDDLGFLCTLGALLLVGLGSRRRGALRRAEAQKVR